MKTLGTLSMAVLLLLTLGSARMYAQDADRPPQGQEEKTKPNDKGKDKDKGAMQEERRDKDQPGMKQDERRDRQQEQKEQRNDQRMDQRQDQKMDQRMERNEHQHAAAAKGKKIPDDKFRAHFGQQHKVKVTEIIHTTRVVPGQTQFVFAGSTFVFVDPWPVDWAFTDDCYIDFVDDEYVLVNPFHPGVFVALNVIL